MDQGFYKQNTLPDLISKEKLPALPQKIGPYKIEGLLSKGGMSLLYIGIDPFTNQTLAIKVLSPSFVTHPEAVARFLKEAQIIGLASHPNIVKLYGQGEWEEGLYIAMEFIRGISLSQFIVQQSFSLRRCIDIILQVSYALLHLHTHGVIHRDLKPENILINEDGEIKVIDFGIAQLHDESFPSLIENKILGTPSYMSPEQREDASKVTFASDIYSLGVIAYELLIGKLSFGMINLSLLPRGLQKILGKALAISLTERYVDIVELISDLSQYLKSEELEKDRPGSDQIKEVLETLQKASSALLPSQIPEWEEVEIGLARNKGPGQMGVYYDFFRFRNNTLGIILAEPRTLGIESSIYAASVRGMIRTLIYKNEPHEKEPLQLLAFINELNQILREDHLKLPYSLGFLLLDPLKEQLVYVSCGLGRLIHMPQGGHSPRFIAVQNFPLGTSNSGEFIETVDNWKIGDLIFFHSLETALDESLTQNLEAELSVMIPETILYSGESQANSLLKRGSSLLPISETHSKVVISLRRVS